MLQMEELVKQFIWGMSVLTAYLHYNNRINYSDVNILCEGFMRDLLNILFDLKLGNSRQHNSPGYDLISRRKQIVIQVSTKCTPEKVKNTFSTLSRTIPQITYRKGELEKGLAETNKTLAGIKRTIEHHKKTLGSMTEEQDKEGKKQLSFELKELESRKNQVEVKKNQIRKELSGIEDIRGYNVKFLFLCENADTVINYKKKCGFMGDVPNELCFCQTDDILCLSSLVRSVQGLSQVADAEKIHKLQQFMAQNSTIFAVREILPPSSDKVDKVIKEYADNFISPLFLHLYPRDVRVTLKNLFVEPELSRVDAAVDSQEFSDNIVALLDSFLWDSPKDRLMFIDGDAAIGKTSLISWLCYHYREFDEIGKAVFLNTQLVCVRLRDVSLSKDGAAEDCILKYLSFESMNAFDQQYRNALIVLEGADELGIVNGIESSAIENFILNVRHAFSNHKIVITSRPKFIDMSCFLGSTQIFSCRHYSLNHFSSSKRAEWISKYEDGEKCGQTIPFNTKQYLSELNDDEAAGVADTPLALYLLASCDMTESLKNNKWALYHEIFYEAIRNTPYNEAFHSSGMPLKHKALQAGEFAEAVYATVGEIANRMFVNFKKERFYIFSSELDDIISNAYSSSKQERINAIRKCCVLCAYWKKNSNKGALEFYHNNIRAFFMCEYIYHKFCDIELFPLSLASIQRFIKLTCEIFQYGIIARTTWAQTFCFLYHRLHYKNDDPSTSTYLPSRREAEEAFSKILYEMVNGAVLWNHSFYGFPYESAKTVFFNSALFLRIWLSPAVPDQLTSFSDNEFQSFWRNSELFKDWIKLFSDTIEVSKDKRIAFGSQMKYQNMIFDSSCLAWACFHASTFMQSTFKGADLRKADFTNCHLENVDFSEAYLSGANFNGSVIVGVNFSSAELSCASFESATIISSTFPQKSASLAGAMFTHAIIKSMNWRGLKFKNIDLTDITFEECVFRNIEFSELLDRVTFVNCSITKCSFVNCSESRFLGKKSVISASRFCGIISDCFFKDVTMTDSNWNNVKIDILSFAHVKINELSFCDAEIRRIAFRDCFINGNINLRQARLSQAARDLLEKQTTRILGMTSVKMLQDDESSLSSFLSFSNDF